MAERASLGSGRELGWWELWLTPTPSTVLSGRSEGPEEEALPGEAAAPRLPTDEAVWADGCRSLVAGNVVREGSGRIAAASAGVLKATDEEGDDSEVAEKEVVDFGGGSLALALASCGETTGEEPAS
jgi:hypothetical protein